MQWLRRLRTWILIRLGLWRGRWRRAQVEVSGVRFFAGALNVRAWRYGLYSPAGLDDADPAPLIVVLHGCKQRALNFAYASGWTAFADRARVRLLCPDQRRLANLFRCWNWFHPLAQGGRGELDVVIAMIDDAGKRVGVDGVAAVGMSAGGALAALLAFHRPERFRAIVAFAAPPLIGLNMQNPQSVLQRGLTMSPLLALGARHVACTRLAIVHGTADDVVNLRCAEQLLAQALESQRRAGVHPTRVEVTPDGADVAVTDFRTPAGPLLRSVLVRGLGHEWTGGPGGHPFCERKGAPLTALCAQFLREAGALG
ncbi:MAG TPA: PHB depolymerase family esterase [Burkholderiaceae bacterium]|nr:PHB depolymerase family esterase [Burkholderiaceae bacterium]